MGSMVMHCPWKRRTFLLPRSSWKRWEMILRGLDHLGAPGISKKLWLFQPDCFRLVIHTKTNHSIGSRMVEATFNHERQIILSMLHYHFKMNIVMAMLHVVLWSQVRLWIVDVECRILGPRPKRKGLRVAISKNKSTPHFDVQTSWRWKAEIIQDSTNLPLLVIRSNKENKVHFFGADFEIAIGLQEFVPRPWRPLSKRTSFQLQACEQNHVEALCTAAEWSWESPFGHQEPSILSSLRIFHLAGFRFLQNQTICQAA